MNEPTEIQPPGYNDVAPSFAISLEEATERIRTLQEFVRNHMTEADYVS